MKSTFKIFQRLDDLLGVLKDQEHGLYQMFDRWKIGRKHWLLQPEGNVKKKEIVSSLIVSYAKERFRISLYSTQNPTILVILKVLETIYL